MLARVRRLFGSGGGNYAYATARVRALKTYLYSEDEFPKLIARDVFEIVRFLQEGRYKDEVDDLSGSYRGAVLIERATRLHLGREFARIHSWCQGEARMLIGLYLERYDVHNMKTVLRGAQARAGRDETRAALIPAGTIPIGRYEKALDAGSLDEARQALADTPYGAVVASASGRSLPQLEDELDVSYYRSLVTSVDATSRANVAFLNFLKREVDLVNLKTVLRSKHGGVSDVPIIPGGRQITEELARRIASAQWTEVPAILDETDYGGVMKPALVGYAERRDLNAVVTALDAYLLRQAEGFGHLYPLSILPIVDYVLRKQREVDRIRIIALGKLAELSNEDIEQLVTA